jgi:hypothetical protein
VDRHMTMSKDLGFSAAVLALAWNLLAQPDI